MKFTTRQLVTLAIFGTLWGVVEISLGSLLHAINLPMSGMFLAAVGLAIALLGRLFVPRRGATLFIGVIAMTLKLFSIGSVVIGPMIGILSEALVAELVLSLFKRPTRLALLLAGSLGVLWTLVQPFVTNPLLFGRSIFLVWLDILDRGAQLFSLDPNAWIWIVVGLAALHLLVGAGAGWLAWNTGRLLRVRMVASGTVPLET
jgi:hypothetical protein